MLAPRLFQGGIARIKAKGELNEDRDCLELRRNKGF